MDLKIWGFEDLKMGERMCWCASVLMDLEI